MAEDLNIVLKTKLDTTEADKQLSEFKKRAETSEIKLKIASESGKNNIQSEVQNAVKAAERVAQSNPIQIKIDTSKIGSAMADLPQKYINGIQKGLNEFESKFGSITAKLQSTSVEVDPLKNSAKATVQYADGVGKVTSVMMKLNAETGEYVGLSKKVVENQAKIDAAIANTNKQKSQADHRYWQGRFLDTVNSQTSTNDELKNLNQYYAELEKISAAQSKYSFDIDDQMAKLSPFGNAASEVKQKFEDLKKELGDVSETSSLDEWAKKFDIVKSEATKLKTELQAINKADTAAAKSNKQLLGFETTYNKLHADAFEKNEQLTGDFAKPAIDSLEAFKAKIEEVKASGNGMTDSAELELKQLQEAAKLAIDVQKSLQFGATDFASKDVTASKQVYGLNADTEITRLQPLGAGADEVIQKFRDLKTELENVTDMPGLNEWAEKFRVAKAEATNLKAEIQAIGKEEKAAEGIKKLDIEINNFKQHRADFLAKPENSGLAQELDNIQVKLQNANSTDLGTLRAEFSRVKTEIKDASGETLSFSQAMQQSFGSAGGYIASFLSVTRILQQSIQTIKSMVGEVRELDTALVDLQKVTGLSGGALDNFEKNAFKMGKQIGRTGTDVIEAAATFSRAGYDLSESEALSNSALVMTNVGVDIQSTAQAASDMISILKAYDVAAEDSMGIIDRLYNVSNKEPLDFGDINDMLVTAGGTLAQTGTSIEESMGLLTGAFATMRDRSVANGLIMISQRLRAVDEDGNAIDGLIPKLEGDFAQFGSSIQDENGELRSTYELLGDLAAAWDTLSSKQKQSIGEDVAGRLCRVA